MDQENGGEFPVSNTNAAGCVRHVGDETAVQPD